ncbi:hypothetical protein [Methylobacter sp.]|uniref:hypothetical protein n=1 Tax=Methylobacter sp. TaxID=2051955 RepID=UPI002FDCF754
MKFHKKNLSKFPCKLFIAIPNTIKAIVFFLNQNDEDEQEKNMRELTISEMEIVGGGVDWDEVSGGLAFVGTGSDY